MRQLLILFILLFLPHFGFAQYTGLSSNLNNGPSLVVAPDYPNPNEQVTVRFDDFRSGATGATLTWFYNGSAIKDANNKREVRLIAPQAGSRATVKLVLTYKGITEVFSTIITPVYLDIIIEPQTHVPGFYQGRALPSAGSQVKGIALLNNGKPLGNNYSYLWRINDEVLSGGPQNQGNVVLFKMPMGSNSTISLQVSGVSGEVIARRTILLPATKPQLHFYEINPLLGLRNKSLTNLNLISSNAIIRSEPYYLDSQVFNSPNILAWTINNSPVSQDIDNPYVITLEKTGEPGEATLGFHVRSTIDLLQGARGVMNINP